MAKKEQRGEWWYHILKCGKKERNRVKGWEIKSLVWDMLNLRLLSIHPMGGDDWAACYISLELRDRSGLEI